MFGKITVLLCFGAGAMAAQADTVLIDGSPATVVLPASARVTMQAARIELVDGSDAAGNSVHLSGNASIKLRGQDKPLLIKAQDVVLQRQPDQPGGNAPVSSGSDRLIFSDGANTKTFVGNVVFNGQTASGPFQIKADRVEYRSGPGF